jgi:flagella basal body P-ring formation protein FlgA
MKLAPWWLTAGLALGAAAIALPCSAATISLDIAPAALVKGPQVTLGEIAVVQCEDQGAAAKLQSITIGCAPLPGKSRSLDSTYIRVRLRQHGFDPDQIQAAWPDAVLVTTRSMIAAGADWAAAGKEALLSQAPAESDEAIATCSRVPPDMVLPEGALELKAEPLGTAAGGSRLVKITALVDGQPYSSQTICYRLQRFAQVLVAHRQIERGRPIAEGDVAVERREVTASANDGPYDRAADLAGLRARRTLRPGDMLTRSSVEQIPAVRRGDQVWVTAVCGAIRVSAEAIACADAPANSRVRLKNPTSGETFAAEIDGEGHLFVIP